MESEDRRKTALLKWLKTSGLNDFSLQPMPGDASFRHYFRISMQSHSFVAMDAEPSQENCSAFVAIARALRTLGLQAPEIIHENLTQGFLLLSDFGDATYLKTLKADNADLLYRRALDALSVLQTCRHIPERDIPPFTGDFMHQEWVWHKEWFLEKLLKVELKNETQLDRCYSFLVESATCQPQVFMHRDYHSANLMVLPTDVGILDFQDAFIGPITYDLVSLLRDCYISWPNHQVSTWVNYYLQKLQQSNALLNVNQDEFFRWFDLMGVQRHLKALLTFARKAVRDEASQYLQHVPRTLNYLIAVTKQYDELHDLYQFLHDTVKPAFEKQVTLCVP